MYPPRSKSLPSGFVAQTFTSNNWTDANVNYLYNYFGCCYADLVNNYIKNAKRGSYNDKEKCQQAAKISFFETGLRTLSLWHNPTTVNVAPSATIPDFFTQPPTGSVTVNVYLSPNPLLFSSPSLLPLIATNTGPIWNAVLGDTTTSLIALGWSGTYTLLTTNHYSWTFVLPAIFGNFTQYLIIEVSIPGIPYTANYAVQFGGGVDIYTPCISLQELQCLVAKMEDMCGCFGCKNTAQIIADNNYVSIGQTFSKPPTPVLLPTNQLPN